jgi:hypothetical protein
LVSFRKVVTTSMRSLAALRCESSLATRLAMRPTTKLKKKPLTIMVMMAHTCKGRGQQSRGAAERHEMRRTSVRPDGHVALRRRLRQRPDR